MKMFWKLIDFFEIKFLTIIIISMSFVFGNFKQLFLMFLIAFIHEFGHFIACVCLKVNTKKIEILPFGMALEIEEVEKISSVKQIIIYVFGPLTCLFNLIWLAILYKNGFINQINYNFIVRINYTMALVNLLPIYPLDGYMILKAIIQIFVPYKKTLKTSIIISFICFTAFIFYNFVSFQPMITTFLLLEQIKHLRSYREIYKKFLIYKSKLKKQRNYKIINDYLMFKDKNNYKIEHDKILNDADIASKELKNYIK